MAALWKHAGERADWLRSLNESDPVRVMCDLALEADCYISQPFESQRASLRAAIRRAEKIETALLTSHLAQAIEAAAADETRSGSAEGESAVPKACAQNTTEPS